MEDFKKQKKSVKFHMTRFQTYAIALKEPISKRDFQHRFDEYKKLHEEFLQVIKGIITLTPEEEIDALLEEEHVGREAYRTVCVRSMELLQIDDLASSEAPRVVISATDTNTAKTSSKRIYSKVPAIELPKFHGNIDEWQHFKDLFESIINKNEFLSDVEKFHHLKTSVKGDAAFIIQRITVCDDNYNLAWKTLQEYYQDTRAIISSHLNQLLNLPRVVAENFTSLRSHVNDFTRNLGSLEILQQPTVDCLLIHLSTSKLDSVSKEKWEEYCLSLGDTLPTQAQFIKFLTNRCQILRARESSSTLSSTGSKEHRREATQRYTSSHVAVSTSCVFCNGKHNSGKCETYLRLNYNDRWQLVRERNLCYACLNKEGAHKDCRYKCFKCSKRHHLSLHKVTQSSDSQQDVTTLSPSQSSQHTRALPASITPAEGATNSGASYHTAFDCNALLQTVLVHVRSADGQVHAARALLDNGSSLNIMSAQFATSINTPIVKSNTTIFGVGNQAVNSRGTTSNSIYSMHCKFSTALDFIILDHLSSMIPIKFITKANLNIPPHLPLADPNFNVPGPIDMILGSGIFWQLTCVGQFLLESGITMQKTKLGWIVAGSFKNGSQQAQSFHATSTLNDDGLHDLVKQFWELESVVQQPILRDCASEGHFRDTVQRDATGRFVVQLPFNDKKPLLGSNYNQALSRLKSLERKFERSSELKQQYCAFINEYVTLGHMTISDDCDNSGYYLPHHAVFKETSTTTKCRVVFDGSCKTTTGVSLNDTLLAGPVIQDDLNSILLRFRKHQIVITADIEKMYRQILVDTDQVNYQKILWRSSADVPVRAYTLNTVTYGTSCAPFLATRCLIELAENERVNFPFASDVILRDFYVDDCISGCNSIECARELKSNLCELLSRGGFNLQKWRSNLNELTDSTETPSVLLNKSDMNTLGVSWNYQEDKLSYFAPIIERTKVTKRTILSDTSRLFDPLGLIGPVIVSAKILLQLLWKEQYDWDESVPLNVYTRWKCYQEEMNSIANISIPRKFTNLVTYDTIELHGFCDSSEQAYGAAIYVRTSDIAGNICVRLLCSKSRVCPLKIQSLPRLELCGALLLSRLTHRIINAMQITFSAMYYWTDSTIVLCWLASSPDKWKTFVANRVSEIQDSTSNGQWRYVPSELNPADIISRGATPTELRNNNHEQDGTRMRNHCNWALWLQSVTTICHRCNGSWAV